LTEEEGGIGVSGRLFGSETSGREKCLRIRGADFHQSRGILWRAQGLRGVIGQAEPYGAEELFGSRLAGKSFLAKIPVAPDGKLVRKL
jgi:hypothetical protein